MHMFCKHIVSLKKKNGKPYLLQENIRKYVINVFPINPFANGGILANLEEKKNSCINPKNFNRQH